MDFKNVLFLIILLNILGLSQAFFETCNQTIYIAAGATQTLYPSYVTTGVYTSSCLYTIVAPVEYQVRAACSFTMPDPSNGTCSTDRFYFGVDGNKDLSTSTYYCGTNKTVALTSNGNQIILAYVSNSMKGTFGCSLSTVCDCGWSVNSRIVNGIAASVNEFPPMVGMVSKFSAKIYCGATIVSLTYCVTAAHCLLATTVENTLVVVGETDVKKGESNFTAVYSVSQFILHPAYSRVSDENDIGLIQTIAPMTYSRAVAPACLPFYYTSADFSGTTVTATGWGSLEFGGPSSDVLQKVDLNVLSNTNSQCKATYPNITSSQVCTFTPNRDTCQYDSGGPLFYRVSRLFIVALVSEGEGCATNAPALNTRITSFLTWIESYTGSLCRRALS